MSRWWLLATIASLNPPSSPSICASNSSVVPVGTNTVVVVFAGAVVLELSIVVAHPATSARHPATSAAVVTGRRSAPGFTH